MNTSVEKILHEVKKVIAGKDDVLEKIMMTVLSRGHVLLDDVPGTGKTTTALAFSRALGLQYGRIQFTPDVLPSDIVGFSMYHKESGSFVYQPGAVMTNLLLADEINRHLQQDPVGAAGGDGGASGHRGRSDPQAARPLCGHCHPEPGGLCRYAAAASGAAGPLYGAAGDGISRFCKSSEHPPGPPDQRSAGGGGHRILRS